MGWDDKIKTLVITQLENDTADGTRGRPRGARERTTQSARSRESIANERQKHTVIHVPKVMNCCPLCYNQYSKAGKQL